MTWDHKSETTKPCEIRKSIRKGDDTIIIHHQCKKYELVGTSGQCYFTAYSGKPENDMDIHSFLCPKDCKYTSRHYVISVYKARI